jgi:NTP pyrophosphatase (non-canonical NTP hydrolase)
MNLEQYVKDAIRTESQIPKLNLDPFLLLHLYDVFTSSGTLLDMVKKNAFYKKPISPLAWNESINRLARVSAYLQKDRSNIETAHHDHYVQPVDPRIFHGIIGLATEVTELVEAIQLGLAGSVDKVNIEEEVGDLMWYCAILISAIGADWDKILTTNIEKLRKRYPEKFTTENAINRDIDVERQILEDGSSSNDEATS